MSKPSMPYKAESLAQGGASPASGQASPRPIFAMGDFAGAVIDQWQVGAMFILSAFILSIAFLAFLHSPVYEATALIEPPIQASAGGAGGLRSPLAGLAALTGGGNDSSFGKYIRVIGSERFSAELDRRYGVAPRLFDGWDPQTRTWSKPTGILFQVRQLVKKALGLPAWTPPTAGQLSTILRDKIKVTLVPGLSALDFRSNVFMVSVQDKDKEFARNLVSWAIQTADQIVRGDQLARTTSRIAYLKAQIDSTPEVYLRDNLQEILTAQEQELMLLRSDQYYAIDVISPPSLSSAPAGSSPVTIIIVFLFLGVAAYLVFIGVSISSGPLKIPSFGQRSRVRTRYQ